MSKAKEKEEATPNLPMSVEDQIKQELQAQKGQIGALPSNKIQLKGKEFTLPDGQKSPGPLMCVILDFVWFMVHYPGVFNSAAPKQPDCFAVGREQPMGGELKPHESVKGPRGESCKVCPQNQWGSAPTGKGKACKNQRRLIVVPEGFDADTEAMSMYVSPGGLKNFDAYVVRLRNEHGLLPAQVITEVSFDPEQSYPLLKFKFSEKHARLNEAWSLKERSQDILFRPLETEKEKT
jgi:hypothetical protein